MSDKNNKDSGGSDLPEQVRQRREKLTALRAQGQAYPNDFRRDSLAQELIDAYQDKEAEALEATPISVKVCGRMMSRRVMGKASFAHLQDVSGRIQLYLRRDDMPEGQYNQEFKKWDVGDIIAAEGEVFKTRTGELSIKVTSARLLTKSLQPLPEKFHGLADQETKYRQRYLDLITSEESRNTFLIRSKVVSFIREYLEGLGFLEVETPMMQVIPGGAVARPFKTHHNALDMELYLRVAPELNLKRLVVGGFERVYEINRNFRNEGISTRHNPEFTMLEFYQAYAAYEDFIELTEDLLRKLCERVLGTTKVTYQGEHFDFGQPFRRLTVREAILAYNEDIADADLDDEAKCIEHARRLGITPLKTWGRGKVWIEIFEKTAEHQLREPTFITQYPTEVSPLSRMSDTDPFVTDRFEFFVAGRELANGFSELNDPDDQAARFRQQVEERAGGDDEAMFYDADYVRALEYGLPPSAGEGIGIDRLVMLLTDAPSIRDVLLFPYMRPEAS